MNWLEAGAVGINIFEIGNFGMSNFGSGDFVDFIAGNTLVSMSAAASVLILLAAVLRPWLGRHLPRLFFLLVWLLVLARLLLPWELPFAGSVYNLLPDPTGAVQIEDAPPLIPAAGQYGADYTMPAGDAAPVGMAAAGNTAGAGEIAVGEAAMGIWLIGVLVCAAFLFGSHLASRRVYDTALPLDDTAVAAWLAAHPLRRPVRVAVSDRISTPLTYGVLRPVLLLPRSLDLRDADMLNYVLTHEWVHIRRFDALWKLLLVAAQCVHWFNPCVWLFGWLADRDLELACDERVLTLLGGAHKKSYARMLLTLEERRPLPLCSSFSHSLTAGRIRAIADYRKPGFWMVLAAAVLALAAGALLLTSPDRISEQEQQLGNMWAESLAERDGAARALLMTERYREEWQAGREYNTIGVSSPWPVDWQITVDGETMLVTYNTEDSGGGRYVYQEQLQLMDTAEGLRVDQSCVTVEYLDSRLYQQVLDMAADSSGLHTWRADPLAVAAKFLSEDAGFAGDMELLEDDGEYPRNTLWQDAQGQTVVVTLYQPVRNVPDIWAVYSYSLGDYHHILDNRYIAPDKAVADEIGLSITNGAPGDVASLYVVPDRKVPADISIKAGNDLQTDSGKRVETVKVVEVDPETGEVARLYSKPQLAPAVPQDGVLPSGLLWPVATQEITRSYSDQHDGVDVRGEEGIPVCAAADGEVLSAGFDAADGNFVVIGHADGLQSRYAHLAGLGVSTGDSVNAGDLIGTMGNTGQSTGAHLHFGLLADGQAVDPLTYSGDSE